VRRPLLTDDLEIRDGGTRPLAVVWTRKRAYNAEAQACPGLPGRTQSLAEIRFSLRFLCVLCVSALSGGLRCGRFVLI
jgi:hypothetical protein